MAGRWQGGQGLGGSLHEEVDDDDERRSGSWSEHCRQAGRQAGRSGPWPRGTRLTAVLLATLVFGCEGSPNIDERSAASSVTPQSNNGDNFGPIPPRKTPVPPRPKLLTNVERRAISLRIAEAKKRHEGLPLANWPAAERIAIEADLAALAACRRRVVGMHPALPAQIAQQQRHDFSPSPAAEAAYLAAKKSLNLQTRAGRDEARKLKEALFAPQGGAR